MHAAADSAGETYVPPGGTPPAAPQTLIDTLAGLRFDPARDLTTAHFGALLGRCPDTVFDGLIRRQARACDYESVVRTRRVAELDGFSSTALEESLDEALAGFEMLGALPRTGSRERRVFLVTHRFLLHAYRYARERNRPSRLPTAPAWDAAQARRQFDRCFQENERRAFLGCNPVDGTVYRPYFRYYDENMETLDTYLRFDELLGDEASKEQIDLIWQTVNDTHWTGDHYYYKPTVPVFECETGFFLLAARLRALRAYHLPHFDRCSVDLHTRLLARQWDSPNWRDYVSRHADTNEQKRLHNTLITFTVLHTYYRIFPESSREAFRRLLTGGEVSAWRGLVDRSGLYGAGRFRKEDTYGSTDYSDEATALGAMLLFLQGIVPESGSLAIPLVEEAYEDVVGGLVKTHFGLDLEGRTLRIPVWRGRLSFQFGPRPAAADFARDGIYQVAFSADWGEVTDVRFLATLQGAPFRYIAPLDRALHRCGG